jgi:hypothetical protein
VEELVQAIRKLKEADDLLNGIAQSTSGRVQGIVAEASEEIRRVQSRLHALVAQDRRRDLRRGPDVPGQG